MAILRVALPAAAAAIALAGCAGPTGYPSLAPRPIEKLAAEADPADTAPVQPAAPAPADPQVAAQIQASVARAEAGRAAFDKELAAARTAASAPGARSVGSEAWVAAQQAVTRADAARGEVGAALADLDALRVAGAQTGGGAAVDAAWSRVEALAAEQDRAYSALTASLPSD